GQRSNIQCLEGFNKPAALISGPSGAIPHRHQTHDPQAGFGARGRPRLASVSRPLATAKRSQIQSAASQGRLALRRASSFFGNWSFVIWTGEGRKSASQTIFETDSAIHRG